MAKTSSAQNKNSFEYEGYLFRQNQHSPVQFSFVATSAQIDYWSRVPTKLSRNARGFQRPFIPGHKKDVTKFFSEDTTGANCSPTSLLIGYDPDFQNEVTFVDEFGKKIDVSLATTKPVRARAFVNFPSWDSNKYSGNTDDEIEALVSDLSASGVIEDASRNSSDSEDDDESEDEAESATESAESEDGESADSEAHEEDAEPGSMEDHLFQLMKISQDELNEILHTKKYVEWPQQKKAALITQLKDLRKHGLIIDGQHRVLGTKEIGAYPFNVVFLPSATWPELAFQFLVNNSASRAVSEGVLISIVGQSLTKLELEGIETRLYHSGIKVDLIQAVMRVESDDTPFSGMLRFGIPGEEGFLDAPAMQKKVVALWYGGSGRDGNRNKFSKIHFLRKHQTNSRDPWSLSEVFGPICPGETEPEKASYWQKGRPRDTTAPWLTYFKAFWGVVAAHFQKGGRLWPTNKDEWPPNVKDPAEQEERYKLFRVTVLGLFQTAILQAWYTHKRNEHESDGHTWETKKVDPKKFAKEVSLFVSRFPDDFFATLDFTGFDASKDVRNLLLHAMIVVAEGKSFASVKKDFKQLW